VRDETLHCLSMIKLFNAFIQENPDIWDAELKKEITDSCKTIIGFEDAFIDLAFEQGDIEGLTAQEVKDYIRYIGDRRLQQLNLEPVFGKDKNPLPWMDQMLNGAEHTNFFENRSTEYSKASTQGSWEEVFSDGVFNGTYAAKAANE
jgi:ribonucleoside-diphosphate reductase beta chain